MVREQAFVLQSSFRRGGWAGTAHKRRLVRRKAPSSLAIYPFENALYSVAFIEESSTFSISHFACARDKSGVASQSPTSTRLAAYTSMRRYAPLDVAAGQPGTALFIR